MYLHWNTLKGKPRTAGDCPANIGVTQTSTENPQSLDVVLQ
jgi:hypothetical protein